MASPTRTNIAFGNSEKYDIAILVLGPASLLRSENYKGDFLIYEFASKDIIKFVTSTEAYSRGKPEFDKAPDRTSNLKGTSHEVVELLEEQL